MYLCNCNYETDDLAVDNLLSILIIIMQINVEVGGDILPTP